MGAKRLARFRDDLEFVLQRSNPNIKFDIEYDQIKPDDNQILWDHISGMPQGHTVTTGHSKNGFIKLLLGWLVISGISARAQYLEAVNLTFAAAIPDWLEMVIRVGEGLGAYLTIPGLIIIIIQLVLERRRETAADRDLKEERQKSENRENEDDLKEILGKPKKKDFTPFEELSEKNRQAVSLFRPANPEYVCGDRIGFH
jgi:hypothetical protein